MADRPAPPGLVKFWDQKVRDFATLPSPSLSAEMKERHRLYSLLLTSLMVERWNGNKYGEVGDYGIWRPCASSSAPAPTSPRWSGTSWSRTRTTSRASRQSGRPRSRGGCRSSPRRACRRAGRNGR